MISAGGKWILNPDYSISRQKNDLFLHDKLMLGKGVLVQPLHPLEALFLALCDGSKAFSFINEYFRKTFNLNETTKEHLDRILQRFIKLGFLVPYGKQAIREFDLLKLFEGIAFNQAIGKRKEITKRRLHFPISLVLSLTNQCLHKCLYCYASNSKDDSDHLLPLNQIIELLDEAKLLGVNSITLSGGEPLMRKDTPKILEAMTARGINPFISTKMFCDEKLVSSLKNAGLDCIQVSLDTLEEDIAERLTGTNRFVERTLKTINLFLRYGFKVRVNCVVSSLNIEKIPDLIQYLTSLGITTLSFAVYFKTLTFPKRTLFPPNKALARLKDYLQALDAPLEIRYFIPEEPKEWWLSAEFDQKVLCPIGTCGLVVLPDGKAALCERVAGIPEFTFGNVNDKGLLEVWNSEDLMRFTFPDRKLFVDTPCFSCSVFERCTNLGKRCYAEIWGQKKQVFSSYNDCSNLRERLTRPSSL